MRKDVPDAIAPMCCHLPSLAPPRSGSQWRGDCPFCGKEKHLYADALTGKWDCKVCGESGNQVTFMVRLARASRRGVPRSKWRELERSRGIPAQVMKAAGVGLNQETGEWIMPCWNGAGTVRDVRRYDGRRVQSTSGCKLQLWNERELADAPTDATVYLCEGEWDAMAMQWLLEEADEPGVVVAVPGATVLKPEWTEHMKGREVVAIYDADDAGDRGQLRALDRLDGVAAGVSFVNWSEGVPKGYDLRDFVTAGIPERGGRATLKALTGLAEETPRIGVGDGTQGASAKRKSKFSKKDLGDAATIDDVMGAFEKSLRMTDDMRLAVRLMLAVCVSVDVSGDPLWLYVVGQPGAAKTRLLTGFKESDRCVFRSKITRNSLISGWKGSKDPSLLPKLTDKTFVVKDFTEILAMPAPDKEEIFSTLRGAYDGYADKSFGNDVERLYEDCHFSMLAGVTDQIHAHSGASMGERFIKFQLGALAGQTEDDVLDSTIASIGKERKEDDGIQRVVASYLQRKVDEGALPSIGPAERERVKALARLVARMRATVSYDIRTGEVTHRPKAESPTRLTKQLGKLAMMLAWVDDRGEVSPDDVDLVQRVAFDTAYGFNLDIVDAMMTMGGRATKSDVRDAARVPSTTCYRRMDDLETMGVVVKTDETKVPGARGGRPAAVYEVNKEIAALWVAATKGDESCGPTGKRASSSSTRRSARRSRGGSTKKKGRARRRTRGS